MREPRHTGDLSSPDEAAKDGAFNNWTCPTCAWTEFDLVEAEEQPANA